MTEEAGNILMEYQDTFSRLYPEKGENEAHPHFIFACHASYPSILTLDILYQIWYNFKTYTLQAQPQKLEVIPFEAVNDFLHAGICQETSADVYRVDPEIRAHLLKELDRLVFESKDQARTHHLAAFLKAYTKQQHSPYYLRRIKDIHDETAEVTLNPVGVLQKYKEKILAKSLSRKDLLRLSLRTDPYIFEHEGFQQLQQILEGKLNTLRGKFQNRVFKLNRSLSDEIQGVYVEEDEWGNLNTHIDKSGLGLESLPEDLFLDPYAIQSLDLSNNAFRTIPKELIEFRNLRSLNLDNNPYLNINSFDWPALENLEELKLTRLDLESVPGHVFYLPNIRKIDLYRNRIRHIDPIEYPPEKLEHLDLSYNRLEEVPEWVFQCPRLEKLYLNRNKLEYLPDSIAAPPLSILHLRGNYLSQLPESMARMELLQPNDLEPDFLKGLTLDHNAFNFPIEEDLHRAVPQRLIHYILEAQAAPLPDQTTFHALIIGIDSYLNLIPLKGAVNDASWIQESFERSLSEHFHFAPTTLLLDQNAHRENIIHELKALQRRVKTDDVVLFYFAGHSHYERVAPYWFTEKKEEQFLQVLTPYDTAYDGKAGSIAIAGLELHFLFNKLTDRGARVYAIYDTHYNGYTQTGISRAFPERTWEDFVFCDDVAQPNPESPLESPRNSTLEIFATSGKEQAMETRLTDGRQSGAFTNRLLYILNEQGWDIHYVALQAAFDNWAEEQMDLQSQEQSSSSTESAFQAQRPKVVLPPLRSSEVFNPLFSAISKESFVRARLLFDSISHAWMMDVGAIQGMSLEDNIHIYVPTEMGIEKVPPVTVEATSTQVSPSPNLDESLTYTAFILGMGSELLKVWIADSGLAKLIFREMEIQNSTGSWTVVEELENSSYRVLSEGTSVIVYRSHPYMPVFRQESFEYHQLNEILDHISQWHFILQLENERTGILEQVIGVELNNPGLKGGNQQLRREEPIYLEDGDEVLLSLIHLEKEPVYVNALVLDSDFSIQTNLAQNILLEGGQRYDLLDGKPIPIHFDSFAQKMGWEEEIFFIKVFVTYEPLDTEVFKLESMDKLGTFRGTGSRGLEFAQQSRRGSLSKLNSWSSEVYEFRVGRPYAKGETEAQELA